MPYKCVKTRARPPASAGLRGRVTWPLTAGRARPLKGQVDIGHTLQLPLMSGLLVARSRCMLDERRASGDLALMNS